MLTGPRLAGFAETLAQFSDGDVIVDLSAVTFMGACGLNVLVEAHRRIEQRHAHLRLVAAPKPLLKIIQVAGLTGVLYLGGAAPISAERAVAPVRVQRPDEFYGRR